MNRREFLKKSLEGIIVGIPLIYNCGKNPVNPILEKTYIIQSIDEYPVKEFEKKIKGLKDYDCPIEIKFVNYQTDSTGNYIYFNGEVKLANLGWKVIKNYADYTGNKNMFLVDTKGELGPVESISFDNLEITERIMNGWFANSGPTTDTPNHRFIAIKE